MLRFFLLFPSFDLGSAITTVMGQSDLDEEIDAPAQTFLMYCIEFFLTTLDRVGYGIMSAVRLFGKEQKGRECLGRRALFPARGFCFRGRA